MYDIPLFTINQLFIFCIIISGAVGAFVLIIGVRKKRTGKALKTDLLRSIIMCFIILFLVGFQCRSVIKTTDYESMIIDRTADYAYGLNFQIFDDSTRINTLNIFFNTNWISQHAKDSVKQKCIRLTKMYLSLTDDLIAHCNLSSNDTFSISTKTHSFYYSTLLSPKERSLSDSIIIPIVRDVNSINGGIYRRIKLAKVFAGIEELKQMEVSIKLSQKKIRDYYMNIFDEKLNY